MKRPFLLTVIGTLFAFSTLSAIESPEGRAIFESKKCNLCHKQDVESIGPSIMKIGKFYRGNEMGLVSYLKGEAEPAIYPKRAAAMQPQLVKIRALGDEKISDLARFFLLSVEREDL